MSKNAGSKKNAQVRYSDVLHELTALHDIRYNKNRLEVQIEWAPERGQKRGEVMWHGADKLDCVPGTKGFNKSNHTLLHSLVRKIVSNGKSIDPRASEQLEKTFRIVPGAAKSGRSRAGSDDSEGSITRELKEEQEQKQREELKKKKLASKKKATTVAPEHGKNNQSDLPAKKDKIVAFVDKSLTGSDPRPRDVNKQVASGLGNKPLVKDLPSKQSKSKKNDTAAAKEANKKEAEAKKKLVEQKAQEKKDLEMSKKKKAAEKKEAKENKNKDTDIFFGVRKVPSRDVSAKTKKSGTKGGTKDDDSNLKKKKK